MKLDILVLTAHPDDAEMSCGGTLMKAVDAGLKVGIVDLTRGEMGSRGTPELRKEEAAKASEIMGVHARDNLGYRDGFFTNDETHQRGIIQQIRRFQPEVIITNAPKDRHPDHGKAAALVRDAAWYSGLRKLETDWDGAKQVHWRPKKVMHIIQDHELQPDVVVDISDYYEKRLTAIKAYGSQFFNPQHKEEQTYISTERFWRFLEARARNMGHLIGATFGEGFIVDQAVKINTPMDLV
ncbi:MAG: bacillithiol biosynthesis deacetylase BshB1 [Bacteroidota bacterium]